MKLLVATAAACVISCSAFAADIVYDDLPTPPVAPPPLPAKFDWSGAYIGVFGGVTTGDFKYNVSSANFGLGLKGSGFIGGAQVGYDWQMNNWVLGAVADIAATNHKADVSLDATSPRLDAAPKLKYLGTVRARAGYAWDRTLFYGHGGFAYGKTELSLTAAGNTAKASQNRTGWTIGAGVEYAMTDRISLGTEYSYVDLGKKDIFNFGANSLKEDVTFHSLRALLNVRF
ncbi:outer membrane protein [Chelativorans sp. J32]|uniref:outer membrane protein n=1 Tax=Chelativorans sp. J32 TaxID=935840 RepID=UPI0004893A58|nr:outer membrane protein [Chelativorans sp. J32]